MGTFGIFRRKHDAELEFHKEFLVKASQELARELGANTADFRGFLCPRCYEKQTIEKSEMMKMRHGEEIRCLRCKIPMKQVF